MVLKERSPRKGPQQMYVFRWFVGRWTSAHSDKRIEPLEYLLGD